MCERRPPEIRRVHPKLKVYRWVATVALTVSPHGPIAPVASRREVPSDPSEIKTHPSGILTTHDFTGNSAPAKLGGTNSGAPPDSGLPADLLFVVSHWQRLPSGIRSAIAAIVRSHVEPEGR